MTRQRVDWDVVIAGAGPAGLTLANHLGALGIRTLVLEALPQLIDYPRGVGMDDETLRSFQAVGLVDTVRQHTVPDQIMGFLNRHRQTLISIMPPGQPFGWPRRNGFIQPLVDRVLLQGLGRFAQVQVRTQCRVEGFTDAADAVTVQVQPVDADGEAAGNRWTTTARYLVGCDGGRSPIRGAMGLPFEGISESTRWLVIDLADDPVGTPNVNLVLRNDFPYVEIALPHGIRRFEFMVPRGADEADFARPERVQELLARVLPAEVKPKVLRHRVYMHHARIVPDFRKGRVFLAGDAAHLMPVWQGQGFNTGIRDATNLAWKLALVVQGAAGDRLLDTYTQERHAHASAMIDLSVLVGRIFVPSHTVLRALRDVLAPVLFRFEALRRYIGEMRFKPMPFFQTGAVVHRGAPDPKGVVGKMLIQPWVTDAAGQARRLDDVIGLRFAIVSWSVGADAWITPAGRAVLARLGAVPVVVRPACQDLQRGVPEGTLAVADRDGTVKRWFDQAPGSIVLLRPDRIVAAVCTGWELDETLRALSATMDLAPDNATQAPVPHAQQEEALT
ncbi:bifunctional 3-(3-hydroxy-phenyl)propionate/3-hydroxycinnamic acid hydroxylase MhpA [Hydrogenophaga sp. BPS33]|uniref:bifunctional 3-(3-hydroxy-phenyl)propionate/3-hydroxycinnamic acid hydroxylase MhpA n=1 Tax=Hydrogenophaga sp. BPS33 TaxID=2651974 RepID=UPI00135ACE82|nr:bifunctional 3-(3-hydroxy-phenyl)propionate/3-hydroxycinnamic acid hydroxylase [Hydrogenophaga sp. BPS33]